MAAVTMVRSANATTDLNWCVNDPPNPALSTCRYPRDIESIRLREYPAIQDTTYLDHAGTTLCAKSMIESYTKSLTNNIFGNPHSASTSSQLSSKFIDDIRVKVLQFIQADPNEFDLVFVSNATAAIKLVADAFRDRKGGFWYGYHSDSHTSLVGVRELAELASTCFPDDAAVQSWICNIGNSDHVSERLMLFAYPGQSNMTGRRLPWEWCSQIRKAAVAAQCEMYTLFDAAALASTSVLNFSRADAAPDFTALSFYKIFGFPDLGALVVRKTSGDIMRGRKYFAGGTVDAVTASDDSAWHRKKDLLHSVLEDGTLPFHSIVALDHAFATHAKLYGSMNNISHYTSALRAKLHDQLTALKHWNGRSVCKVYDLNSSACSDYGPVIAFNLLDSCGNFISNSEVEKLATVSNVQFRTGGLCNPGGIATYLDLTAEDTRRNYAAGLRCGGDNDIIGGKPTGVIRVSLGAMSSHADISRFIDFLQEFYVSHSIDQGFSDPLVKAPIFHVESIAVFPIKSCSAFTVPHNVSWEVTSNGLAWDREWCLVHQGTNVALSQKRHPRMALIQPEIDLANRLMSIRFRGNGQRKCITIDLDQCPTSTHSLTNCEKFQQTQSLVCGESVSVCMYTTAEISQFFTEVLEVPCSLARYCSCHTTKRLARLRQPKAMSSKAIEPSSSPAAIKLSNESPILLVSRSSVDRLNEQIQQNRSHPQHILPESFRANIIIAEKLTGNRTASPYAEDFWQRLRIGSGSLAYELSVLGPCQRCQMVCVDQSSAKRRQEPFSTLAKTRRWDGGVWFGIHLCLSESNQDRGHQLTFRVGDIVIPS